MSSHPTYTRPSRQRSALMARVRQRGTSSELAVRLFLKNRGVPFRTNGRHLPGRPDLYISTLKIAVFVHGCFWHRHQNCRASTVPKTNVPYWTTKFVENVARDRRKARALRVLGYHVFVIWECQTREMSKLAHALRRLCAVCAKALNEKKTNRSRKEPVAVL